MTRRVLFIGEDVTLAHVARPIALARALDSRCYEVNFAGGARYRALVEAAGFSFASLPSISHHTFLERLARGQPVYTASEIERYVTAELELFDRLRPDVVVGDFRLSLGISADVARLPFVAIANAYWSPYSCQRFPMPEHWLTRVAGVRAARMVVALALPVVFRHHARAFNAVRRRYGLPSVGSLRTVYTYGTWTLYADLPRLAPTAGLPPTHRYVGPILWEPDIPLPPWWDDMAAGAPLVYVSVGTSGDAGLQRMLIEALGGLPVVVALSTAGHPPASNLPANVFVAEYLPGLTIASKASLVIGNGGSLTNYQALSQGVPVLGLPSNADQYLAMESVVREGAGILLRSGRASAADIRAAVARVLDDPGYRRRAQDLAAEITRFDAPRRFAAFLESIA